MREYLLNYISKNSKVIKIILMCLLIGLIIGLTLTYFLNQEVKNELTNSIKSTLDLSKDKGFESINILKNGIMTNLLVILIIYFLSITLIAPICICIISLIKGFSIGLYIPTLFLVFGFGKGILVLLLLVILPNIIFIPSYVYMCVNAINFHYKLLEEKNKLTIIFKESYNLVIVLSLIILSILIEQLASFGVISLYLK